MLNAEQESRIAAALAGHKAAVPDAVIMKAKNHPFPGLIVITSPNSSQIYSVHVARRFYSGEAEDGGRNVNVERNLGALLPRLNLWSAHVERNFDVKLVRGRFAFYHAELSNVIAVV